MRHRRTHRSDPMSEVWKPSMMQITVRRHGEATQVITNDGRVLGLGDRIELTFATLTVQEHNRGVGVKTFSGGKRKSALHLLRLGINILKKKAGAGCAVTHMGQDPLEPIRKILCDHQISPERVLLVGSTGENGHRIPSPMSCTLDQLRRGFVLGVHATRGDDVLITEGRVAILPFEDGIMVYVWEMFLKDMDLNKLRGEIAHVLRQL